MTRIFDHKKQYVCTEVFRLEELQKLAQDLEDEDMDENDKGGTFDLRQMTRHLTATMNAAAREINDFIKNMEEQERRK
ncbi:MAG: hypothetical protein LLG40_11295 [Deltaproteobacteria bacterium]|nr:hypothetical protein [Deltaproteobacteria bacterium]